MFLYNHYAMHTIAQRKNSPELQILKTNPSLMPLLKEGDLIEVTFIENGNKAVFFDVPKVGTGIIYGMELINARNILKKLSIGDSVAAKVVEPENEDGFVELSLAEASKQKSWQIIKELKESDELIKVTIKDANAGGLIAEVYDLQAFLPASQLSNEHYPKNAEGNRNKILKELQGFIGKEFSVKIIGVNPRAKKFIISEREVVAENIKELLKKYAVGDVVKGIVSGVANFGVFIRFADHPEIEGLIHISEISHNIIDNPKEVVAIGDMVEAKLIEIRDGRVSLSLKALQSNPWDKVKDKFSEGATVEGVVYKLSPFGAFIKLDDEITGLLHVSEFGSVEELKKKLEIGKRYPFVINSIKPAEKRIILGLNKKIADTNEKKDNDIKKTYENNAPDTKIQGGPEGEEN